MRPEEGEGGFQMPEVVKEAVKEELTVELQEEL